MLEHVVSSYREAVQKYWCQKASLELDRLTEDVLTLPHPENILLKATSGATLPIRPIGRTYTHYNLASWPVPYVNQEYSIQVNLDQNDVRVDTVNGDLFEPSACVGWRPMVCRTGPTYTNQQKVVRAH